MFALWDCESLVCGTNSLFAGRETEISSGIGRGCGVVYKYRNDELGIDVEMPWLCWSSLFHATGEGVALIPQDDGSASCKGWVMVVTLFQGCPS